MVALRSGDLFCPRESTGSREARAERDASAKRLRATQTHSIISSISRRFPGSAELEHH